MIEVEKLCFHYRCYQNTLKDISFTLDKGEFLAILGNNGAGKSTLLKCINRILKAESGNVKLDGKNLFTIPFLEVAKKVAFVSQSIPDIQITVHDMVMLGRRPYMKWGFSDKDHKIIHQVMERLNLVGDIQGRFMSRLSGGEKQKVMLARALAQEPSLLLLDEPTSSLDIYNQYHVLQTVQKICKEDNISVIMVIHDLNLALRFCDKFLLMSKGEVYKYGDKSILDEKVLQEVYKVRARPIEIDKKNIILIED